MLSEKMNVQQESLPENLEQYSEVQLTNRIVSLAGQISKLKKDKKVSNGSFNSLIKKVNTDLESTLDEFKSRK